MEESSKEDLSARYLWVPSALLWLPLTFWQLSH